MTKNIIRSVTSLLCGILLSSIAVAQSTDRADVPRTISYQGIISSTTGSTLPQGEYPVTVRLYSDEHGETVIWEGQYHTFIEDGLFNLQLGSGEYPLPTESTMDRPLWLGVQVGDNPEMSPRSALSAVPYALTVPDGSITAEKMGTEYISAITIDGERVTGRGMSFNIRGGEGIDVTYDPTTQGMEIGLSNDVITSKDEKGHQTQAANSNVYWSERGNNNTNPANDFVGTSDNTELEIHVNGNFNGSNTSTTSGDRRVMLFDPQTNSPNIIGGYQGNLPGRGSAIEGATIGGGGQNTSVNDVRDDFGTIGGGAGNRVGGLNTPNTNDDTYATISGGLSNVASASNSTVGGGTSNVASATNATIGGGTSNAASATSSTVSGGASNAASATNSAIGGGITNTALAITSTIGGGESNYITIVGAPASDASHSTIGGGFENQIGNGTPLPLAPRPDMTVSQFATIAGGWFNTAIGDRSAIGGGEDNVTATPRSTIGGGFQNIIYGNQGTIGGGDDNYIGDMPVFPTTIPPNRPMTLPPSPQNSTYATIGGGNMNSIGLTFPGSNPAAGTVFGNNSTIGGGVQNTIQSNNATVGGGNANTISINANNSTIGGGIANNVNATDATVGGGNTNTANGTFSTIGGGQQNIINGTSSAIPGGRFLQLGANSFGFNGDNTPIATPPTPTNLSNQNGIAYFGNVDMWIGNVDGTARTLRFYEGNANDFSYSVRKYVGFNAPTPVTTSHVYTLPPAPPVAPPTGPQVSILTGNSAGTLSWTPVLSTTNGGTGTGATPITNGVAYGSSTGTLTYTTAGNQGEVLTADANGVPTWQNNNSLGWSLTGNSTTTPGTNYLGTSDNTDLVVKTNGLEQMRVAKDGNVTLEKSLTVKSGGATISAGGLTVSGGGATITGTSSVTGSLNLSGSSSPLLVNGSAGTSGQVLVSQGSGTPQWQTLPNGSSSGWQTNGNSAGSSDFIGTTNNVDFVIRTNNSERVRVDTDGHVGIGTATPKVSVDIDGGLAVQPAGIQYITGNTNITIGDRTYIRVSSTRTPSNAIITLPDGTQDGQIIIIECIGDNYLTSTKGFKIQSTGNVKLTGNNTKNLLRWDNITLIWDPSAPNGTPPGRWIEIGYRNH